MAQPIGQAEEPWWLPDFIDREFSRPYVPPVDSNALGRIDPALVNRDVLDVRSELRSNQVKYENGLLRSFLEKAHMVHLSEGLITLVQVPHPPEPFTRPDYAFILTHGGFYPFHAVLMAAYCSRLRFDLPIPPTNTSLITVPPDHIPFNLRITLLPFRNDKVMACFRFWVYRQDDSMLRPALLPPAPLAPTFSVLKRNAQARKELSMELATTCDEPKLWEYVSNVLDCRRLVTMLGVDDERVWVPMEVAWDVLLNALNLCCIRHAAADEARGVDTSAIKALLNDGLGLLDTPPPPDPDGAP